MRKFLAVLVLILIGIVATGIFAWSARSTIASRFLAKELNVPVSIQSLDIDQSHANITRLKVGNPPQSKTPTSFSAEKMNITSSLKQIASNPLVIDEILIQDIFIEIEFYNASGEDNNWARILSRNDKEEKISRDYMIHTLILKNLTVEVTQSNGKVKRYPTIQEMEFHNISSATGFPIDEIEKAIFDLMIKEVFKKLLLDQLLKTINPIAPFLK